MTPWEDMHVAAPVLRPVLAWLSRPTGLLLLAGSTGSGKTTFIDALLRHQHVQRTARDAFHHSHTAPGEPRVHAQHAHSCTPLCG